MRYQLISPMDYSMTNIEQILYNRGINPEDIKKFKYPTEDSVIDPLLLKNVEEGAKMLIRHVGQNDKIFI